MLKDSMTGIMIETLVIDLYFKREICGLLLCSSASVHTKRTQDWQTLPLLFSRAGSIKESTYLLTLGKLC